MKKASSLVFLTLLLIALSCDGNSPKVSDASGDAPPEIKAIVVDSSVPSVQHPQVAFSPSGGCTELIQDYIGSAKATIYMQAYGFTSKPISDALVAAQNRGVAVTILLDKSNLTEKSSKMLEVQQTTSNGKVSVFIDAKHAIAHNKVIIVDKIKVQTGSFNYTEAAEKNNAENCIIISDPDNAAIYLKNWQAHRDHSTVAPTP